MGYRLLGIIKEMKLAKESGNWNAVFAGLTIFGVDFFNETWNGWVHSAPHSGPRRATRPCAPMVGWNIEIMFMFSIVGIIFYHTLTENKKVNILGLPEMWFWAIGYSVFCVFVECLLNKGNHLGGHPEDD